MNDLGNGSELLMESSKRKFLPWNSRYCGGVTIQGTVLCSSEPDEQGLRKCYCNPPPDQNYELCYNLASKVYESKLHVCEKDVGNAWALFALKFCAQPHISMYDPVQGPACKKSFHSIVRKARALLSSKSPSIPLTPYESLMDIIISDMDNLSRERQEIIQQKQMLEAEKKNPLHLMLPSTSTETYIDEDDETPTTGPDRSDSSRMSALSAAVVRVTPMAGADIQPIKKMRSIPYPSTPLVSRMGTPMGAFPTIYSFDDKSRQTVDYRKELELRERQIQIEEAKLLMDKERWEADLRLRDETIKAQNAQIEAQNKIIFSLLEKLDGNSNNS